MPLRRLGNAHSLPVWAVLALQGLEYLQKHRQGTPACPSITPVVWTDSRELVQCRADLQTALTCPHRRRACACIGRVGAELRVAASGADYLVVLDWVVE